MQMLKDAQLKQHRSLSPIGSLPSQAEWWQTIDTDFNLVVMALLARFEYASSGRPFVSRSARRPWIHENNNTTQDASSHVKHKWVIVDLAPWQSTTIKLNACQNSVKFFCSFRKKLYPSVLF